MAMSGRQDFAMMGGGNPAHIPEVNQVWKARWEELAGDAGHLARILGNYDAPAGHPPFLEALSESLARRYDWPITPANIAVVNGSQNAFFYLLNMLAPPGQSEETRARVLLPLTPEYIGYADQLIPPRSFLSIPPKVECIGDHRFKYHINFDRLQIPSDVAALCVSRPTNPTGNVLTADELAYLESLAMTHGIPLILDNAYGAPFPDIIFTGSSLKWSPNVIRVMSLSKLGLPGTRTGIIIGPEDVIASLSAMNAAIGLATGTIGQALVAPLLADGRLYELCHSVIRPYYERKSRQALNLLDAALAGTRPYRIHLSEGALFLWIWLPDLPITSAQLYQRLKERGVLVMSGHHFFYGNEAGHPHQHQCLRLSYAQSDNTVQRGIEILADEIRQLGP